MVKHLGYVVSPQGIATDPDKTKVIQQVNTLTTVKGVGVLLAWHLIK